VTFDCFEKLPFIPKAKICQLLLEKNIMFELNYGDAVQDPNKRRQFISNAAIIIKSTKGKNILMSSDTSYWLYHRSPYDLVALGMMVGLKKDQAT
jgi:ribonuclease P/MRP protein subunit RPP1